jgi:hypothetical protein
LDKNEMAFSALCQILFKLDSCFELGTLFSKFLPCASYLAGRRSLKGGNILPFPITLTISSL